MKLFKKQSLICAATLALSALGSSMYPITITHGTNLQSFDGSINSYSKAFDRTTGTLYVATGHTTGTSEQDNTIDNTYALSALGRNSTSFIPLATDTTATFSITNRNLVELALVKEKNAAAKFVAMLERDRPLRIYNLPLSSSIPNVPKSNAIVAGADGNAPAANSYLSCVTGSSTHIFARLNSTTNAQNGLVNLKLQDDNTFNIIQGSSGEYPLPLHATTNEVKINTNLTALAVNDMVWDDDMESLYIGMKITVPATANAGGFSIVKAKIDYTVGQEEKLFLEKITTTTPKASTTATPDISNIFAYQNGSTSPRQEYITVNKLGVMKTSSGRHYLMVAGGPADLTSTSTASATDVSGNTVYALRLAETKDVGNTFKKGDIIQNDVVTETALTSGFTGLNKLESAFVGNRLIETDTDISISDMVIVGDAVYVSTMPEIREQLAEGQAIRDAGIFVSRAMFNDKGLISSWTKWERVLPSTIGGGDYDSTFDRAKDSVPFFEVDAVTGKIIYGTFNQKQVKRTEWQVTNPTITSLQNVVSKNLSDGCYSVLDLPSGTPGIFRGTATSQNTATSTPYNRNSLALFGGYGKVAFALTRTGGFDTGTDDPFIINTDYSQTQNFNLISTGLENAGAVRCLGYTYGAGNTTTDATTTNNYFYAGTENGLYALAKTSDGTGFYGGATTGGLARLNSPTFTTASWQPFKADILGSLAVTSIIAGKVNDSYVVGIDKTKQDGISHAIYKIIAGNTVNTSTATLVAKSGYGGLPENIMITGLTPLAGPTKADPNDNTLYGVISTNNGLYVSAKNLFDLNHANTLTSNLAAANYDWISITATSGIPFLGISSFKDIRSNTYAFGSYDIALGLSDQASPRARSFDAIILADDYRARKTYTQSQFTLGGLDPLGTKTDITHGVANGQPIGLNPLNGTSLNSVISTVPLTGYTKSDGGRRFFTSPLAESSTVFAPLYTLPFDTAQWGVSTTGAYADANLSSVPRIYWVETISGTGHLFAGTDKGVISLE